jgi:hypothetical protein
MRRRCGRRRRRLGAPEPRYSTPFPGLVQRPGAANAHGDRSPALPKRAISRRLCIRRIPRDAAAA